MNIMMYMLPEIMTGMFGTGNTLLRPECRPVLIWHYI